MIWFSFDVLTPSVGCISAVVLIEGLCGNTVEKLSGENAKQRPSQIKRLEDVPRVIGSLGHKLPLKFVQELQIQLCFV